ncbi:uncharacterized protein LOC134006128 isoform X1 [Scomber scombrus]|uniref:uncharacterized protein LOC134006128 isoform X1 n=1 Tax=Scomber scombrus TaxID=13677 RepID=UPI002DDC8026|nr:uncharacterized protein LOC134006128 isoform X1 [Scomber scombrus]
MIKMKETTSKCGLTAFSVSFFQHAVVLLLLTDCCGGVTMSPSELNSNSRASADSSSHYISFAKTEFFIYTIGLAVFTFAVHLLINYMQGNKAQTVTEGGKTRYKSEENKLLVEDAIKKEIQTDGNKTREEMKKLLELQRETDEKTELTRRIKEKDDIILDLEEKLQMKASLVDALNFQKQTLENQKDQLKEKLQQKANMADGLKEQKQTLENHKDQMKLQLKEVEKKKEENKEKLLSVENKITEAENKKKDKGGLLKEKENLTDVKWKLDEQKTNWEKLILSVEQMLQRIDVLVNSDQVQETTVHSNQGFELLDERRTGVSF